MFIHIRSSLKFIFLLIIATALIIGIVSLVYKPAYSVTLNGEFIGYTAGKSKLQSKINEYMKTGDGENIAFVDIDILPEYSFCFLKREVDSSEEKILEAVKELGTVYYEYYAIMLDNKEKSYVKNRKEAEKVINELKDKESANVSKLAYTRMYDTEIKEFSKVDSIVTALYEKPEPVVVVTASSYSQSSGRTSIASVTSAPNLGIGLIQPTSGIITSRFGRRGNENHSGLDIAGAYGTQIKAAASGTVVYSGWATSGYRIICENITWKWSRNIICTL